MSSNAKTNINAKLEDLKTQIDWFSSPEFQIDQVLEKYQKAVTLAKQIQADLEALKNEIVVINNKSEI